MSDTPAATDKKSATNPQQEPERYLTMLIKNALKLSVSDVHIKCNAPPYFRLNGDLHPLDTLEALKISDIQALTDWFLD